MHDEELTCEFNRLAWLVADDGCTRHERTIAAAVTAARRAGWGSVALDVLADREAPEPARQRALGRIHRPRQVVRTAARVAA